uniref:hypothetical protein n=1 Tax=Marinobacterium profundum TaxID=1714300 RepID=UPI00082FAA94|nr:hypothetical protein [Marinobacterium profundum]
MTVSLAGIELPLDMQWTDEFEWTPVRQQEEVSLTGALVVEEAAQTKGRRITLEGGQNAAWVTRATVEALYALAQTPATPRTLVFHSRTFTVLFRHREKAISAAEVSRQRNPGATNKYTLSLRLMEVA